MAAGEAGAGLGALKRKHIFWNSTSMVSPKQTSLMRSAAEGPGASEMILNWGAPIRVRDLEQSRVVMIWTLQSGAGRGKEF